MQQELRTREGFQEGWRFYLGEVTGGETVGFDDTGWTAVTLPHDWGVAYDLNEGNPTGPGGGYARAGVGWYRKHFTPSQQSASRHTSLLFDGVYMDSTVYLNGQLVGGCASGYSSFDMDLTATLQPGENVLAVRVDNAHQPNSRWYTGSGIYRRVWLETFGGVHLNRWGVFAHTTALGQGEATLEVRAEVANDVAEPVLASVLHRLLGCDGNQAASVGAAVWVPAGGTGLALARPAVASPRLWQLDDPYLYTLETTVTVDGVAVDRVVTPVGIRTATFDADRGFLLNGRQVKIQGMCVHHDGGLLGAAARPETWRRRLALLAEMGCNAIRCAHNPPMPDLLDLCDQMGFLVMDEAFDEWLLAKDKSRNYYSEEPAWGASAFFSRCGEDDLLRMLHRDRNHPSVMLWSVGNEIPEQSSPQGVAILRRLVELCHREDPSRMVTSACDNIAAPPPATTREDFLSALDVVGYNYADRWREHAETLYDADRQRFPQRRVCGSENASAGGLRGVYTPLEGLPAFVQPQNYPAITLKHEWLWRYTASRDFVAGDFLWTGVDYLGEAPWPLRGALCGPIDTAGFAKDTWHYFRSIWNREAVTLHLLPHWNWPGREGEFLPVVAYTNCDEVRLYVNGRFVGARGYALPNFGCTRAWTDRPAFAPTTHDLHLVWDVPYEPGELRAVGYRQGRSVAETVVATTGAPVALRAVADGSALAPGGIAHIEIDALDAAGRPVPDAAAVVRAVVEGPGRLLGMDAGDPRDHTHYYQPERRMLSGRLLAVVLAEGPGTVTARFSAAGLADAMIELTVG